ncbi:glucose oxidase [Diaporthe helianthi]|uniref:Glucose oxidase n=1 Tax=Diaporthe helianthi TaxID=158607 RepID=A0A2P5I7T5_DIAHE|nr:glucose oxidase [Diaporthe helianthi]
MLSYSVIILLCARIAAGLPAHAASATIIERQHDLLDEYDYIIAGGGTAGLTVADRLTESGNYTVLIIEYGYLDASDSITALTTPDIRAARPDQYSVATRWYNDTTEPQVNLDGRRHTVRAGCTVGGSSAINGMLLDRGSAEDYDSWVLVAGDYKDDYAAEWGWENILPAFRKSVTFHQPTQEMQDMFGITYDVDAAYQTGGTPAIHSSYRPFQWPIQRKSHLGGDNSERMFNAFKKIPGIASPKEANDGSKYGVVWAPNSIDPATERRSYAKTGHYDSGPVRRANFHILPAYRVVQVTGSLSETDGLWVADGVRYKPRGSSKTVSKARARKEVIVSAGTFHTPQLLERSGIGPREILEAAGVPVNVALPGVGNNFQSHTSFGFAHSFGVPVFPTAADLTRNSTFAAEAQRQWDDGKKGAYTAYVNSGVWLPFPVFSNKTEELVARIEAQAPGQYLPAAGADPTVVAGYAVQKKVLVGQLRSLKSAWLEHLFFGSTAGGGAILQHIFSRGTVHISPRDDGLDTDPVIDYRAFSNPVDEDLNVELLQGVRWYMAHEAMVAALQPRETSPRVFDDAGMRAWMRRNINPDVAHQVGTAAMGPKELGGVVGPDLRVHGTRGLSVADNSIVPMVPGSHTSALAYAAADLILRRA